ncbi:MAG: hypothetical protein ABR955_01620 [Verrucomicrobiota bacterium]
MQTLAAKSERESWMEYDDTPALKPRRAVLNWFNHPQFSAKKQVPAPKVDVLHLDMNPNNVLFRKSEQSVCDLTSLWQELQKKWDLCELKTNGYAITFDYGSFPLTSVISPTDIVAPTVSVDVSQLESEFDLLSKRWKKETQFQSSISAIVMHPAYLDIIGMGRPAIKFIHRDLKKETNHWFTALRAIAKISPIKPEDAGNLKKMREAWLKWGKENGYPN